MATQTIERPVQRPAADLEALFPGRYLSMTSFKHDGTALPITVERPHPLRDDGSHTPPHGDAILVHGDEFP
jgi:hypothetical protein